MAVADPAKLDELEAVVRAANERLGFVSDTEMPVIARDAPLVSILVRCGNGRFTVPAKDAAERIAAVEAGETEYDYIRDVSIQADALATLRYLFRIERR